MYAANPLSAARPYPYFSSEAISIFFQSSRVVDDNNVYGKFGSSGSVFLPRPSSVRDEVEAFLYRGEYVYSWGSKHCGVC